ncbi:MAG: ABC transporter substrate-binding protein [Bacteroidales bacterium]|nr:ABC transporter substrate-binding protein [Bacteroidales bacterium]HOI31228.1 ABC transporter substrate-binding protein [Bacteroidales bacterium]
MNLINPAESLFEITERYPQTVDVFVRNGFPQMADEQKRRLLGRSLRLDIALSMKGIDLSVFMAMLEEAASGDGNKSQDAENKRINIKGLLPCPVRLPLQEAINAFLEKEGLQQNVNAELKAASMGLDWLKDDIGSASSVQDLDDIYISAGFDLFFEDDYFGRFIKSKDLTDPLPWKQINADFDNESHKLKDPESRYGILAVVPAIFLVNQQELYQRPVPQSWSDLLDEQWEDSISLPVSDFDLFNAIMLTIRNTYGMEGVAALGRNMQKSLHPAQMLKSDRTKSQKPAVTIMPYFFTRMAKAGGPMMAVWPKDGAIVSPIFVVGKESKKQELEKISAFLGGEQLASILAHQGLFPSLHPEIDNGIPMENKYLWLGWDYINKHNLNQEFEVCTAVFDEAFQSKKSLV